MCFVIKKKYIYILLSVLVANLGLGYFISSLDLYYIIVSCNAFHLIFMFYLISIIYVLIYLFNVLFQLTETTLTVKNNPVSGRGHIIYFFIAGGSGDV